MTDRTRTVTLKYQIHVGPCWKLPIIFSPSVTPSQSTMTLSLTQLGIRGALSADKGALSQRARADHISQTQQQQQILFGRSIKQSRYKIIN